MSKDTIKCAMHSAIEILQYYFRTPILNVIDMYMGVNNLSTIKWYNFKQESHRLLGPAVIYMWCIPVEKREQQIYSGHYDIKDGYLTTLR